MSKFEASSVAWFPDRCGFGLPGTSTPPQEDVVLLKKKLKEAYSSPGKQRVTYREQEGDMVPPAAQPVASMAAI